MKIADVKAWIFHSPLDSPFKPSWVPGYSSMMSSAVIYELTTDTGISGIAGGNAFADEAKGPVNLLRAYLLGIDVDDSEQITSRLGALNRVLGMRSWFIETAFWDIRGKASGRSIAATLGANTDRVRAYASTGELREPEEAASHAKNIVAQGFKGIKIRTRHDELDKDIAMVQAVREAVGDTVAVMCDANQAWRVDAFGIGPRWDLERAAKTAEAMETYNVAWLEEPLDMFDLKGYAELRKRSSTPIAAGELHGEPSLVGLLIDAGGVDIVQPDLVFTGGISGAWGLAQKALSNGLRFSPHTWSNGLGLAANLHLAVAAPNCDWLEFPYDPPGWVPEHRDAMIDEVFAIDDNGDVVLPTAPGLGVDINREKLETFAVSI
ncbi:MAG: mandelate racemase/muconate lactonizing enzyme family protein [Actinomycetota bacterium]|nr:mandelate racemase/muconate lactonizing enzyme family protein [Actinomycetota bacterium]